MSIEETFLQQFTELFVRYRDALTLDTNDDRGRQLERLNEAAESDRSDKPIPHGRQPLSWLWQHSMLPECRGRSYLLRLS